MPPGTALLGIIGERVGTSLSPAMHNAAFARLGIDARYLAFPIGPAEVRPVVHALAPLGFLGLNVTIPYKETAARLVDRLDPAAAAIGAVNTIVVRRSGLAGHNTDAPGFLAALREGAGITPRGRSVLVAGAGGAARAVAWASLRRGSRCLVIANRSAGRATALARGLRRRFPAAAIGALGATGARYAAAAAAADIIVNTTPLGAHRADPLPVPGEALRRGQVVMDIVYRPVRTPLLAAAAGAGALALDGLGMLLHQGALAFALWTGRRPPLATMRRALLAAAAAARP